MIFEQNKIRDRLITIKLSKQLLKDIITTNISALGSIIGAAIFGWGGGYATVIAISIGGAIGWIIGGSLSRKYIT